MLVNHQSQPFRVKLIDFGLAMETHKLRRRDTIQVCGFRAPEVNLGLPLTEAGLKRGTDEVVALKFIHKDNSESATREATILKHLRELQADQKNLIKLIDHFEYNDSFCFVFEMLDMDLFGLLEMREREPLDVSEVRVVARDLLVALNALKNAGVTHADIKPDNIMLVNHQSQPFRVKLIDFGLAMETHKLRRRDTIQVCGFRAPEVNLGLPLTEAVDMWAVACTLAAIFLGDYIYNPIYSIDDFLKIHPEIQDPFELEDLQAFIDLLKKMFKVNPSERITPVEALNHRFITMSHLPKTSDNSYVTSAYEKMKLYRMEKEEPIISPDFNVRQTEETTDPSPDFIVGQTSGSKSDLFDLTVSDYDLSDSKLG
uniref:Protein kinase domain-containing protein n=1 Tax=Nothobranchius furzeri TaxID=105023 RepID=A0A8C6KES1_NOTFU